MKLLTHPAVTALGLTEIYLVALLGQLVSSNHDILYHWSGSATALFLPTLINFCLLWILLTLLLLAAPAHGRRSAIIWTITLVPIPWVLSKSTTLLTGKYLPFWFNALVFALAVAVFVTIVVGWRQSFSSAFDRVRRLAAVVIGYAGISTLLVLGQLCWFAWRARGLNAPLQLHQQQASSSPPKTRIIWILFDELSYQQVYGQRFAGLRLPAFDRIASESTVFTQTVPAGTQTENVIPSLFTGRRIDSIRASSDGRLLFLHSPAFHHDPAQWMRFDPGQTIFQDALNAGYSTALAGWYNPYCRIMPQVLDHCFWTFNMTTIGGTSPDLTVAENVLEPLRHAIAATFALVNKYRHVPATNILASRLHILDFKQIANAADPLLRDPSVTFIYLHVPVPHPQGIYDRRTGQFATTNSTYVDNLALADRYLAHVRTVLEQNGTWDDSTIIVMGDHSWRTSFMWKPMPYWSLEEQVASHSGQYDPRPVYIVKLPHQQHSSRIDFPYAAMHTRALLDTLIANQIRTPDDLSGWASQWNEDSASNTIGSTP